MQTLTNLFNQALTAVGAKSVITDPTDNSREAKICKLWIPVARRNVFGAFYWPSIREHSRLSLIARREENLWHEGDPPPGYGFTFSLPDGCLRPQFLHDHARFELGQRMNELCLFTNATQPILAYTKDIEEPGLWEADLYNAVVFSLAAHINLAMNGKVHVTNKLERTVLDLLETNSVAFANSENPTYLESIPSFYHGTGLSPAGGNTGYMYPTQSYRVAGVMQ